MKRTLCLCDNCGESVLEATGGTLPGIAIRKTRYIGPQDTEVTLAEMTITFHFCDLECFREWVAELVV